MFFLYNNSDNNNNDNNNNNNNNNIIIIMLIIKNKLKLFQFDNYSLVMTLLSRKTALTNLWFILVSRFNFLSLTEQVGLI